MEKDIGKISKNDTTEVIVRVDDFGGRRGLTIREFVTSERYTGFTKAGTRISAENFPKFKEMINSIDESEMAAEADAPAEKSESKAPVKPKTQKTLNTTKDDLPDY